MLRIQRRQALLVASACGLLVLGGGYWLNERLSLFSGQGTATVKAMSPAAVKKTAPAQSSAPIAVRSLLEVAGPTALAAGQNPWVDLLNGLQVGPGEAFSMQRWEAASAVKIKGKPADEQLSEAASMLYESALRLGLTIGDRRPHLELPAYAAAGFDVEFVAGKQDFSFLNPNTFPITWSVEYRSGHAVLIASGGAGNSWSMPIIDVKKEELTADKLVLANPEARRESVKDQGHAGLLVKIEASASKESAAKVVAKDIYMPKAKTVERPPVDENAAHASANSTTTSPSTSSSSSVSPGSGNTAENNGSSTASAGSTAGSAASSTSTSGSGTGEVILPITITSN